MQPNEILRKEIFDAISNQMRMNKPPETKITLARLKSLGYSNLEAKELIGQCLLIEIYSALKYKQPYDNNRYVNNLKNLPKAPVDENKDE